MCLFPKWWHESVMNGRPYEYRWSLSRFLQVLINFSFETCFNIIHILKHLVIFRIRLIWTLFLRDCLEEFLSLTITHLLPLLSLSHVYGLSNSLSNLSRNVMKQGIERKNVSISHINCRPHYWSSIDMNLEMSLAMWRSVVPRKPTLWLCHQSFAKVRVVIRGQFIICLHKTWRFLRIYWWEFNKYLFGIRALQLTH